jgi:hypothetical protein
MCDLLKNKLKNITNCIINKQTPIDLINNELMQKSKQNGKKRTSHPVLWQKNLRKILRNSVNY